jgi:NAD(P)-dependent dehydrogenase (short-subunit alcohol dehydrogenase family)
MARIFITGSSGGLGLLAGRQLAKRGHRVVLHARDAAKTAAIRAALPGVEAVVEGDLETMAGMRAVAQAANALGRFDAVIHNAGVGERGTDRLTADGLPVVFAVNVLAPYLLTALIERPDRMVYLSSGMHSGARPAQLATLWRDGRWMGRISYSQTKFLVTALAFAAARLWPGVRSNAVDPGWVPTRMGGSSAPTTWRRAPEPRPGSPRAASPGRS